MKKLILPTFTFLFLGSVVFFSCKSKTDSSISPDYKSEVKGGTGGNPSVTNVTTTGITATVSPYPSSVLSGVGVGGAWSSSGCQTGQTSLSNYNQHTFTTITVDFFGPPTNGTYQLVSSKSLLKAGKAFMTVTNPPSQDEGSVWYSSGGTINVVVSGASITGNFSNIVCYKTPGAFYSVTVSGQVGCL